MTDIMEINVEQLIHEVHKRPAIWDMRTAEYANRNKKKSSWEEITIIFVGDDASAEKKKSMGALLQKKWKHVYSREVSERKVKSGQGARRRPPYMYVQQLSFLTDVIENCATDSSLDIDVQSTRSETPQEFSTQETPDIRPPAKKRKGNLLENKLIEALENNMARSQKQKAQEDDDRHFLLSLLPSIKAIPLHFKLAARMEIMQCINKYIAIQTASVHQPTPIPTVPFQTASVHPPPITSTAPFQTAPLHQPPPTPSFQTTPLHHTLHLQPVYDYDLPGPSGIQPTHSHFSDPDTSTSRIRPRPALPSPSESVQSCDDSSDITLF